MKRRLGALGLAKAGAAALALSLSNLSSAAANTGSVAGEFTIERPTLNSLGFEWRVSGDDNRNATVAVRYRKAGGDDWHEGLPLFRLQGEPVVNSMYRYIAPNLFAGSIFNLQPGTDYEAEFTLSDPDGMAGETVKRVTAATRPVPVAAAGGHVYHVYPAGHEGKREEPAFIGLMAAYYMGADQSDHANAYPPRVQPGDTIIVHAGLYRDSRLRYGGGDAEHPAYGTPFDGTYYLTQKGTAEKPITIRAAGDGEVIFDGGGNYNLFNLMAADYHRFEGITVRNTEVAFLLGHKNIAGASGFSLVRSRIEDVGRGVEDDWAGSEDFYIADNVFIGRHDPDKLLGWWPAEVWSRFEGFPQLITSEYAVKVYGRGHVVAYNRFANWHDGVDIATYGTPAEDAGHVPASIDFHNNDFTNIDDNCIEVDGGAHNIRVYENRCFNTAAGGFSAQPTFGGPAYFFRNISYNGTSGGPLKLFDNGSGILVYQNTFFGMGTLMGPVSNVHFRNNLFIGDGWAETVFNLRTYTNYSSSDYNGFHVPSGAGAAFGWTSPAAGKAADYAGELEARTFPTLEAYRQATGQEAHSIPIGFDTFEAVAPPDTADPQRLYDPKDYDFRLKRDSAAIDAGTVLPNITDGYTGKAPDLGAYERGRDLPHYGPREE